MPLGNKTGLGLFDIILERWLIYKRNKGPSIKP